MIRTVQPGSRRGTLRVPASKSVAHRLLITAAFSVAPCVLHCSGISNDIAATIRCLNALGADITIDGDRLSVKPIRKANPTADLYCGESGSTLRFLIPVAGMLGCNAVFHMEGRLPERPIETLTEECVRHGMRFEKEGVELRLSGKLTPGSYTVPGNISSQFITGLLLALPFLNGDSALDVTGAVESAGYIRLTEDALHRAGIQFTKFDNSYTIPGNQHGSLSGDIDVEADWSSAAFPLCMGALSNEGIEVRGLNLASRQGDAQILEVLERFGASVDRGTDHVTVRRKTLTGQSIDASQIPDMVPAISVVAAAADGKTIISGAERLRLKESDRIASTTAMLRALGGEVRETEDGLIITGNPILKGGQVDPAGDHRIAMSAAAAASVCEAPVTILNAECTDKSYPNFWEEIEKLPRSGK